MSTTPIVIETRMDLGPLLAGQKAIRDLGPAANMAAEGFHRAATASTELGGEINYVNTQNIRARASFDEAAAGATEFGYSVREARGSARMLADEVGLHLNRELSNTLARSEVIGPLLSKAFGVFAIAGFAEIAVDLGKKMYDLYQDVFNLKSSFEELANIEERMVPVQLDLSNSISRSHVELLRLKEGGIVGARAELESLGSEIINLQSHFDVASEAFKKMPTILQDAFKTHTIFPAKEIGEQISDVEAELHHLHKAVLEADVFGTALDRTAVTAQTQAYTELLDLLTLKQAELGQQTQVATERLQGQLETFSKSGYAASQQTLKTEFKPPDFSTLAAGFSDATSQMTKLNGDFLLTVKTGDDEITEYLNEHSRERTEEFQREAQEKLEATLSSAKKAEEASTTEYETEFRAGQINLERLVGLRKAALAEELHIEEAALNARLNTIGYKEVAEQHKILDQMKAARETYEQRVGEVAKQAIEKEQQDIKQATQTISRDFTQAFNQIITGHEKVGAAALKLGQELELYIIDQGIKKVVTHYATELLQMLASHSSFLASMVGIESAGNAARTASQIAANSVVVMSDAGVAFAGAFSSVMAAFPFPANMAAAPGIAAAAAAETIGGGMAFEYGGIVPGSSGSAVPIMAHAKEMVLPEHISSFVQDAAAGRIGAAGGSGGGAGGGDVYHTVHNHNEFELHVHGGKTDKKQVIEWIREGIRHGSFP